MERGWFLWAVVDIVRGLKGLRWVGMERGCIKRECYFYPCGRWVEERAAAAVGIAAVAGIVAVAAGTAVVVEAGMVVVVAAAAGTGWNTHQHFEMSAPLTAGTDYSCR